MDSAEINRIVQMVIPMDSDFPELKEAFSRITAQVCDFQPRTKEFSIRIWTKHLTSLSVHDLVSYFLNRTSLFRISNPVLTLNEIHFVSILDVKVFCLGCDISLSCRGSKTADSESSLQTVEK